MEPQDTLRGLNQRLRVFLERVAQLQRANSELLERIEEWGKTRRCIEKGGEKDAEERAAYELRSQINRLLLENAELALCSQHTKARVSLLQSRCEVEEGRRLRVEQQVCELRERKGDIEVENSVLEKQVNTQRDELHFLQQQHQAERDVILQQQQQQQEEAVLESDGVAAAGEDGRGMELPRVTTPYRRSPGNRIPSRRHGDPASHPHPANGLGDGALTKDGAVPNRDAPAEVRRGDQALREARAELADVRKRWNSLQVEIESLHAMERGLQSSLRNTQQHYSLQLQDLSQSVRGLEVELDGVRSGLVAQKQQHSQLLNTKMRLEREIATYRKLLEHEEGRFLSMDVQPQKLRPWRSSAPALQQNSLTNGLEENAEKSANHSLTLKRQGSLVILTESIGSKDGEICTVKTQEILEGNVVRESAEGHGRVETEKIDKVIKKWEGSFFRGNPKLRKKSVSLRFDLHMAAADEGCTQTTRDSLPDVEVRLVMKRSRSIPTITP